MAAGADPSRGPANPAERLQAALMNRIMTSATRDRVVAARLIRVLALLDPPTALMRPSVLWRALAKGAPARAERKF
jgi:hypothetical protein